MLTSLMHVWRLPQLPTCHHLAPVESSAQKAKKRCDDHVRASCHSRRAKHSFGRVLQARRIQHIPLKTTQQTKAIDFTIEVKAFWVWQFWTINDQSYTSTELGLTVYLKKNVLLRQIPVHHVLFQVFIWISGRRGVHKIKRWPPN